MSKDTPRKARFTLVVDLMLFLSGLVAGWLIYPAPLYPVGSKPKPSLSELGGVRQFRPAKQLAATLRKLAAIEDPEQLAAAIEQLPTRELPSLLVLLIGHAGFEGLPDADWPVLRAVLSAWHTRDPNQAIGWALAWENPANRFPLMVVLVAAEAVIDPVRAITLCHEHLVDANGTLHLPDAIYREALKHGQDTYLVCLKQSVHSSGVRRVLPMDFPEGFDFPKFAGDLAAHVSSLPEGLHQAAIPLNFSREWAKQDPGAAFKWTLQNPGAVSSEALAEVSASIAQSSSAEISAFLRRLEKADDTSLADLHGAITAVLDAKPEPAIFAQYIDSFESPEAQHRQLVGLFRQSLHRAQQPDWRIQRLILERVPANDHARFFLEIAARRDADGDPSRIPGAIKDSLTRELVGLGHPPAKIDSMLEHF